MPPLPALLALHGLWLLLIVPLTLMALRLASPGRLRLLGILLTTIGVVGLGIVGAREAANWLPSVPAGDRSFYLHRVLFVVFAELTSVPLVPVTVGGLACWFVGRRRASKRPSDLLLAGRR
jgi:hypothetical protein